MVQYFKFHIEEKEKEKRWATEPLNVGVTLLYTERLSSYTSAYGG